MNLVITIIGLLLFSVCFCQLLRHKQNYGASEITWKRLKVYLGSTYSWLSIGSIVGLFLIIIGINWNAFIQFF